jgi:Planctomycete cytochrome C
VNGDNLNDPMSQSRQPPKKQPSNRPDWLDDVAREFPVAKGVAPPPARQPAPVVSPKPRVLVGIPVKPRPRWRWLKRIVWTCVAGIGALMMFVSGLECGYWRAQRKYEAALEQTEQQLAAMTTAIEPPRNEIIPPPKPELPKPSPPEPEPPKPEPPRPPAQVVRFDMHILPIFQAKCITCHSAKPRKGELDLRTLQSATKGGENGAGVLPGDPDSSTIWRYISRDKMPPRGSAKLTPNEKMLIQQWIAGGAK